MASKNRSCKCCRPQKFKLLHLTHDGAIETLRSSMVYTRVALGATSALASLSLTCSVPLRLMPLSPNPRLGGTVIFLMPPAFCQVLSQLSGRVDAEPFQHWGTTHPCMVDLGQSCSQIECRLAWPSRARLSRMVSLCAIRNHEKDAMQTIRRWSCRLTLWKHISCFRDRTA